VAPHAEYLDHPLVCYDLIDDPMLNVDPSGVGSGEITNELLERWRRLVRILRDDLEEISVSLVRTYVIR